MIISWTVLSCGFSSFSTPTADQSVFSDHCRKQILSSWISLEHWLPPKHEWQSLKRWTRRGKREVGEAHVHNGQRGKLQRFQRLLEWKTGKDCVQEEVNHLFPRSQMRKLSRLQLVSFACDFHLQGLPTPGMLSPQFQTTISFVFFFFFGGDCFLIF